MKNEYKITDYSNIGLPSVQVYGESFCYKDLYEFVGKHQFMTTFNLKSESSSSAKFGRSLTGVISYNYNEKKELANQSNPQNINYDNI